MRVIRRPAWLALCAGGLALVGSAHLLSPRQVQEPDEPAPVLPPRRRRPTPLTGCRASACWPATTMPGCGTARPTRPASTRHARPGDQPAL